MLGINYWAVVVAAIAAFVASSVWYMVFGKALMEVLGTDPSVKVDIRKVPAWKKVAEFVRGFIVAYVLARFVVLLGVAGWIGAVQLGAWLWIGFPFMILTGAILWDNRPWKFAAIHSGDWLMKLLLMTVILSLWRK